VLHHGGAEVKIVGFAAENMASSHLRVRQWIDAMKARGHSADFYDDGMDNLAKFDERVRGADVVVYGRTHDGRKVALLHGGKKVHGYKIVCDTDDLVTDIPSYNFAAQMFHDASGFKRLFIMQYRLADAVTCSTRYLVEATKEFTPNVYLVPNCADMALWSGVRTRQKEARHRDDIRVYWGGGGGHWDDVLKLRDPLLRIFAERPQVKLIFSNFVPAWAATLPQHRVFFLPLAPYRGPWQKILAWLCVDIGLAPLVANPFNRAKSHVKWLDYGMARIAGVYESIDAYDSVVDGVTGLKASTPDEWYERIRLLVDESALRQRLGDQARRDVMAHWMVGQHVADYERMLKRVCGMPRVEVVELVEGEEVEAVPCQT
jgi:hypothetical protein